MQQADCFLSVVVPIADDADIIEAFAGELLPMLEAQYANFEVILVDDGSRDGTPELISRLLTQYSCIRYIRLSQRSGIEIAISCGFDAVIGDYVAVLQPATDPLQLIPEMVNRARAGSDVVFGIIQDRSAQPFFIRFAANSFYWLSIRVFRLPLTPNATLLRVLSRRAMNAVSLIRDRARFLRLLTASTGFRSEGISYTPIRRRSNERHKSLFESVSLAVGLIVSNSRHPLRLMSFLAFCASAGHLAYIGYIVAVELLKNEVAEGWTTLSMQQSASFVVLFMILGVLCEYVGQIREESRERPLYVVEDERTSTVMIANEGRRNVAADSDIWDGPA